MSTTRLLLALGSLLGISTLKTPSSKVATILSASKTSPNLKDRLNDECFNSLRI